MFRVSDLTVAIKENQQVMLRGVNFEILPGETLVLKGKNGSGKSTLLGAIMGDPRYEILGGEIEFLGEKIQSLSTEGRSLLGMFLSFQTPPEVNGVSTTEIVRTGLMERGEKVRLDEVRNGLMVNQKLLGLPMFFMERECGVGMSGGEKKKNEILQMLALKPKFCMLDELDSGLDMESAGKISQILADYQRETNASFLIISHNLRILEKLKVDKAVELVGGELIVVENERGDEKSKRFSENECGDEKSARALDDRGVIGESGVMDERGVK